MNKRRYVTVLVETGEGRGRLFLSGGGDFCVGDLGNRLVNQLQLRCVRG